MNLEWLIRGSLVLLAGYVILAVLFRTLRPQSTAVRQGACAIVLLAAWQPVGALRWEIPWYAPAKLTAAANEFESLASPAEFALNSDTALPEPTLPTERTREPVAPGSPRMTWPAFSPRTFVALWIVGVALLIARGVVNYITLLRRTYPQLPLEPHWQREWDAVRREADTAAAIPILVTRTLGPMLGLLPRGFRLLLPAEYWSQLDAAQRRTVLRHELAHYRRGDILATFLFRLAALPFWFHPAAWRIVAWFEEAAEDACDREAVRNGERTAFARALELLLTENESTISPTLGRCARSHPLVARVRRVLNPIPYEDSLMKTSLIWAAAAIVAVGAAVKIQLVAQEPRDATLETVQEDQKRIEARLGELKAEAEQLKSDAEGLKTRVEETIARVKTLAAEPERWSEDARKRIEQMKSGEGAKQLAALEGSDGLKDERLILLAYAAKDGATAKVQRKSLEIACTLGETGLAVIAHAFESLANPEKIFVIEQIAKAKHDFNPILFAKVVKDADDELRTVALTAGLETKRPLLFLALVADSAEGLAERILARTSFFEGDDLQSLLYALAKKGPESLLPQTIREAAKLKVRGYPVIAEAYLRKTPEARAEIVRLFKKSTIPVEQRAVKEALADEDSTLREAAEKANAE